MSSKQYRGSSGACWIRKNYGVVLSRLEELSSIFSSFRKKKFANAQKQIWKASNQRHSDKRVLKSIKIKLNVLLPQPQTVTINAGNPLFCSLIFLQLVRFLSYRETAWKILLFEAAIKYAGSACPKKQKPWQECWLPWQSKQPCMAEQLISVQIQEIQPSLRDFVFNIVLPEGGGKTLWTSVICL